MPKHFHTLEIVAFSTAGALIGFHSLRFIGAKLAKSERPTVSKIGRAVAGLVVFGSPQ